LSVRQKVKTTVLFLLSSSITGWLVYSLLSQTQWTDWERLFLRLNCLGLAAYLGLYTLNLFLRTWRYHILLQATPIANRPAFGSLTLVTMVRNMLVDFLPARLGSLSYIVILNRVMKVDLAPCLTSFTYSFIFDLLGLAPLLGIFLFISLPEFSGAGLAMGAAALLLTGSSLLFLLFIEPALALVQKLLKRRETVRPAPAWSLKIRAYLRDLEESLVDLGTGRVFWLLLAVSVSIRLIKYLMLSLLLLSIIAAITGAPANLPWYLIFLGLIASEAAAALPIGGLAGFGLYEGVLGLILASQGIDSSQALLISFFQHLLTQIVDYGSGAGALIYLMTFRGIRFSFRRGFSPPA
jgi:hypothetical protein